MPTEPQPVSLSQLVRRAAEIADPDGDDPAIADFEEQLEDADEPVAAILDSLDERVELAARRVDPEGEVPQLVMAAAVVKYLARRRDEVTDVPEDVLRLAARAEFDGDPPPVVEDYLNDLGVSV